MSTEDILRDTLTAIRRDGWRDNGWGLVPPWSIRRALGYVVENAYKSEEYRGTCGTERDEANQAARQAISKALGQPLGLIHFWETRPGRTQTDVENVLEKAIAGVGG